MRRVADHPLAVVVKHADLDDNSDPQRLAVLPPDVADRLRDKYRRSRELLASFADAPVATDEAMSKAPANRWRPEALAPNHPSAEQ